MMDGFLICMITIKYHSFHYFACICIVNSDKFRKIMHETIHKIEIVLN